MFVASLINLKMLLHVHIVFAVPSTVERAEIAGEDAIAAVRLVDM